MAKDKWSFDSPLTKSLTEARRRFTGQLLESLRGQAVLCSALDVGCGLGDFSKFMSEQGFQVVALDGREENIQEGQRRYPEITFRTADAEELSVSEIGTFDLVLCFGLLYHLENPFRTIRSLHSLTKQILLVEGMCVPSEQATMELLDEKAGEDQGFSNVAFYPSELCLIKMLYRAGFPFVYRFDRLPANDMYVETVWRKRARTFLVASKTSLALQNLVLAKDPIRLALEFGSWSTPLSRSRAIVEGLGATTAKAGVRLSRFLRRPWSEKREILSWYLRRF
jgi:SAM-dependent methyltransferase